MKSNYSINSSITLCWIVMAALFAASPSLADQKNSLKTSSALAVPCVVPDPSATTMTFDVVLEGTIALVQRKDGSIQVFFPQIPGHVSPYYLALNEAVLKPSTKGDYVVKTSTGVGLTPAPCDTIIAPDPNYPILTVPYPATGSIDPNNSRFASILLPKPYAILPLHSDPAELKTADPCDAPSTSTTLTNYATRVTLRYVVTGFDLSLYDPSSVPTKLQIPRVGSSGTLFFGVGPEQPDDQTHHHARVSFQKLQDLFPIQRQYVAFPMGTDDIRARVRSGIDCRAPMLLLTPQ